MTHRISLGLCLIGLATACAGPLAAADRVNYLHDVKPILAQKCFACHGALKQQSGLRLDAISRIRAGGDSGPVIAAGNSGASPLVQRVSSADLEVRMPPEGEGEPLDARQLALVRRWIDEGAEAPDEPVPPDPREHWSFKPPVRPAVPLVKNAKWPANTSDSFVGAAHERLGLAPSLPADKNVLLRRVYLDLIGLPPTPDELKTFANAAAPDAWERVVDRLLAQPEYGQRWGRHWMDVWRYSDWAGYKQEVRESQRHIWRWRDWIIESLNGDKGYDRMVLEMLAGDELAPADPEVLRATGFLVRNRHSSNRNIWLDATVEHTAKAFLGLTINCARCHDHKFDPIGQVAYYQMRAIFEAHDVAIDRLPGERDLLKDGLVRVFDGKPDEPTYRYIRGNEKQPDKEHPLSPGLPDLFSVKLEIHPVELPREARYTSLRREFEKEDIAAARKSVAQSLAALDLARAAAKATAAGGGLSQQPEVLLAQARHAAALAELESLAARYAADFAKFDDEAAPATAALAKAAARLERLAGVRRAELAQLQAEQALTASQQAAKQDDAKVKAATTKAEKDLSAAKEGLAKARAALEKTDDAYTPAGKPYPQTSTGRRLALGQWITRPDNPLAARVAVNHLWLRHFGSPLVENVFDFGLRTPAPAHAELLDWLAVELVERGWSMKHLHRLMVSSETYRQASGGKDANESNERIDPDNRCLWRMNTRRLEAELVRDCLLYVSGGLDMSGGGPDIDQQLGETSRRRSVYFRHAYEKQMPFLVLFDAANVNECYRRSESVIPQQALAVANSTLSLTQSRLLARELSSSGAGDSPGDRSFIELAFARILSRRPTAEEVAECEQFLTQQSSLLANPGALTAFGGKKSPVAPADDPRQRAREGLIHVLLNHNDFVTIR